jgi:hypothetical protein
MIAIKGLLPDESSLCPRWVQLFQILERDNVYFIIEYRPRIPIPVLMSRPEQIETVKVEIENDKRQATRTEILDELRTESNELKEFSELINELTNLKLDELHPDLLLIDYRTKYALRVSTLTYFLHQHNYNLNVMKLKMIVIDPKSNMLSELLKEKNNETRLICSHPYETSCNQAIVSIYSAKSMSAVDQLVHADEDSLEPKLRSYYVQREKYYKEKCKDQLVLSISSDYDGSIGDKKYQELYDVNQARISLLRTDEFHENEVTAREKFLTSDEFFATTRLPRISNYYRRYVNDWWKAYDVHQQQVHKIKFKKNIVG